MYSILYYLWAVQQHTNTHKMYMMFKKENVPFRLDLRVHTQTQADDITIPIARDRRSDATFSRACVNHLMIIFLRLYSESSLTAHFQIRAVLRPVHFGRRDNRLTRTSVRKCAYENSCQFFKSNSVCSRQAFDDCMCASNESMVFGFFLVNQFAMMRVEFSFFSEDGA